MFCLNKGVLGVVIIITAMLTGCASTPSDEQYTDMKRSAMHRWNACLERNLNDHQITAMQVTRLMRNQCEGYRRDIVALFPAHLSGQVDQALVSSAYRYINARSTQAVLPADNEELIRTLLR